MRYYIADWQCHKPPVPEAVKDEQTGNYYIEIDDIHQFCEKLGCVILCPPGKVLKDNWFIWVQGSGSYRFNQS